VAAARPDLQAIRLADPAMTAHPDHVGFAERARTDAGAQADAEAARTGKPGWKNEGSTFSYLLRNAFYRTAFSLARRGAVKIIPVKEVSSFADGEVIDVPGSPRALHTPGHTPGSAAIAVEKRNALLAGDAMCTWNPYTGRGRPADHAIRAAHEQRPGDRLAGCPACGHRRRIASGPRRPLHRRRPRSGPTSQSRRPLVTR
jgi:glyoxylase-like metal-dependent hydrolase (beta-lactamase superfamily II)